ncbi:MAG: DEAD/DEAH box helicase [Bacteroidia bacterium]|nr:DEAD/DEAH box helicase [Bacteroidia bacterium]
MREFGSYLDDTDKELIRMLAEISPREVLKKHKISPQKELEFFVSRFQGELQKIVLANIQRRIAAIIPRLAGRAVYVMGKDGYPAKEPIEVLEERATILFHFKRTDEFTRYYPTIKLQGEIVDFRCRGALLLCNDPAWMLFQGKLFSFEPAVDGKKLQPFLTKEFLFIPRDKEEIFYSKFVPAVIERYPVYPRGFEITDIEAAPQFSLQLVETDQRSLSLLRRVSYGRFDMPLEPAGAVHVEADLKAEPMRFFRVFRDQAAEARIRQLLEAIEPRPGTLTPWEYLDKETALSWISRHKTFLETEGIRIQQNAAGYRIHLDQPEIVMQTTESGDWFDIKATVRIGQFEIPFIRFRTNILRNIREYKLPDGTVAILPEQWFTDYQHLLAVSEPQGEDTFRLRRYHAPLLYFPTQQNGRSQMPEALQKAEQLPEIELPVRLHAELRNYQVQGYNWLHHMKSQGMGAILADDMGLGKTLQTLTLLLKEYEDGIRTPSLIIVPTSLVHNWRNEVQKFAPSLRLHLHTGIGRYRDPGVFAYYDLILTTYGIVRQDIEMLKEFPFHYLILDESQTIKNPESKTAQAARRLTGRHRLSLTGTPIENTVMDIWSQMSFLNPGLLGNEHFFKEFYVTPIEKEQDARRSAKLRRIIYPFILRRRKHQVEEDLPPKVEKLHFCEMTETQAQLYEEVRNTYRNYLLDLINQGTWKRHKLNILAGLQKLRQIAIHPKMVEADTWGQEDSGKYQEVKRLLKQVIEGQRSKVLIFSQFVKMLHIIREDLDREGIRYAYLDGQTRDRQAEVDRFQTDREVRVFLISLRAGGVGLNLTAADYVFILDPWWNPAVENQAIDRSHRIGQKRTVFYYKFITEATIEEKILSLQRAKAQLSDDIISVEEDVYKLLEADDLERLLEGNPLAGAV